jgi:glycosyltransferase involved in cell wall biosynthesis
MAQELDLPYPLRIISQPNRGRAAARNHGAAKASGELLVLLDDDMEAQPSLLSAHRRAHADSPVSLGIIGAVPITGATSYVEAKFNQHLELLARKSEITTARDIYTGNFSVRRDVFEEAGCFDEAFTEYGNEDVEFALRLRQKGVRFLYSPDAIARQYHAKTVRERVRDAKSKGRTAVLLADKHPECWSELELANFHRASQPWRFLRGLLLWISRTWAPAETMIISTASLLSRSHRIERLLLNYCFWIGVSSVKPLRKAIFPPKPEAVTREEHLNRLLRRVDWRFLSSDPTLAGAEVIAGPELTAAVRLLSPNAQAGRSIVLQDPDEKTLRDAAARLALGATLYVEWNRPLAGGSRTAARRVEEAGLEIATRLWVWPMPPRMPRAWLPIDSPGAIRWFAEPRQGALGQNQHVITALLRLAWRAIALRGALPPYRLLAFKSTGETDSDASVAAIDRTHTMMITAGHRSVGKVVLLTFANGTDPPTTAMKVARTNAAEAGLDREEVVLREVERARPLLQGVPRVMYRQSLGTGRALGETVMQGVPLQRLLNADNHHSLARKVTDWTIAMAGTSQAVPSDDWWERLVGATLETFREQFGSVVDPGLVSETQGCLRTCGPIPLVIEHRDLGPWNILLNDSGRIQVLDWESAELRGLPGLDLIYFLAFAGFAVDRAESRTAKIESYRRSLSHDTPTGRIREACLRRYLEVTKVSQRELQALTLMSWLVHTRSDFRRLLEDTDGRPSREELLSSTFLALWDVQVRSTRL